MLLFLFCVQHKLGRADGGRDSTRCVATGADTVCVNEGELRYPAVKRRRGIKVRKAFLLHSVGEYGTLLCLSAHCKYTQEL